MVGEVTGKGQLGIFNYGVRRTIWCKGQVDLVEEPVDFILEYERGIAVLVEIGGQEVEFIMDIGPV